MTPNFCSVLYVIFRKQEKDGSNMQGVCGPNLTFDAVTCCHAGGTDDYDAFVTTSLKEMNESLISPFN